MADYFNFPVIFKLILWLSVNIIGYIVATLMTHFKYKPNPNNCCQIMDVDDDGYVRIGHNRKSRIRKVTDFNLFITYALVHFYFSDIINRLDYYDPYQIIYFLFYIGSIPAFGLIGSIKGLQTSCSWSSIKGWSIPSWITYVSLTAGVSALLGYHVYLSYDDEIIFYYLLSIVVIALYYIGVYFVCVRNTEHEFHLHHWFLAHILCFYFRFDNIVSNVVFSIAYGIMTQGAISYSMSDIID